MTHTFVIVGAGMAGGKAAEALRDAGFDGRIVLLGAEAERPYERPPLSKDYLRGEADRDAVYLQKDPAWYEEHAVELRTETVVEALDVGARAVVLAGGERVRLRRAAAGHRRGAAAAADPGGRARRRPRPAHGRGLRRAARRARRRRAARGRRRRAGSAARSPPRRASAAWRWRWSRRSRCRWRACSAASSVPSIATCTPSTASSFTWARGVEAIEGAGRAERVRTADGAVLECAAVLLGVGVAPRTALAEGVLRVDNGIVVDAGLRTSVEDVFAAGDVANHEHPLFGPLRVEHWANALEQGPAAARAMLGEDVSYERVPYFFSDQYDVGMEYAGHGRPDDEVVFRGDPATREFIAFWLRDGCVEAGMNVNVWDVNDAIQDLVRDAATVDVERLRDPDVPLDALLSS